MRTGHPGSRVPLLLGMKSCMACILCNGGSSALCQTVHQNALLMHVLLANFYNFTATWFLEQGFLEPPLFRCVLQLNQLKSTSA